MATIVNTPNTDSGSGAGWAVAVVILLVVLLAAYFGFARWGGGHKAAPSANINVTLPSGGGSGGGSSGGGTGGGSAGGGY